MSTSTVPAIANATYRPPGIPADKAFKRLVFHEPTICSRCFVKIRELDTYRPDTDAGVSSYAPTERYRRAHDGEKGECVHEYDGYGYRPFHSPRTFCGDCGSQSGRADDAHILSKAAMMEHAQNLADRLDEAGVVVHADILSGLVGKFKSKPKLSGYDTEIYGRATKLAIRHARENPRFR